MRWPILFLSLLVVATARGQQFELVEPSGVVTGNLLSTRGRLTVLEQTGEQIVYVRERRYDSADGQYVGFVSVALNRVIRFPRDGEGRLLAADLDDVMPRFRYTRRLVRPRGAIPAPPPGPPIAVEPPAFPLPIIPVDPFLYPPAPQWGGYLPPFGGYYPGYRYPQSLLIDSQVIPNAPLPAAKVEFFNGGRREIQVGLIDLDHDANTRSMRIPPGQASQVVIQRDSGGEEIRSYRTVNFNGDSVTQNVVRPIPPRVRYEVVVHEWAMQSVAIDRTGKSPNPIEDINFQGRGLGRFLLPPGDQLGSTRIDVYQTAIESGLAGTVAPILAEEDDAGAPDSPLERAVLEAQQRAILEAQRRAQRGR